MVGIEDAFPVARGHSELELNYLYSHAQRAFDDRGDTRRRGDNGSHLGAFSAKHGFTTWLDASVGIFARHSWDDDAPERRVTGLGDLLVDAKWRFYGEGESGLHLAYQPSLSIPIGKHDDDKSLSPGLGYWSFAQKLIATWIEDRWVGGATASFALPFGDRNGARGVASADLGLGYQITPWLKPEIELHYVHDFASGRKDTDVLAATAGAILKPSDALRVDLGLRHGFYGRNADRRISAIAKLVWAF